MMLRKLIGLFRPAMPVEIGRCSKHNDAQLADASSLELGVGQVTNTNGEVETLLQEIDFAIRDPELYLDLRMLLQEFADRRSHIGGSEQDRSTHAQQSGGLGSPASSFEFCIVDLQERGLDAAVEGKPSFSWD